MGPLPWVGFVNRRDAFITPRMETLMTGKYSRGVAACVYGLAALSVAVGVLVGSPGSARATYVIGSWDLSRGGFDSLADAPEQATQRTLIQLYRSDVSFTSTPVLTDAYLATVKTFVLGGQSSSSTAVAPLSAAEQAALFNFVSAGGELLVATWNGNFDGATGDASRASIYAPFGMATDGQVSGFSAAVDLAHPIVNGPFGTLTSFALDRGGWYTDLGPYAQAVFVEPSALNPMLATIDFGGISATSGRAVFVADANAFSSALLSGNVLAYLVPVPEPDWTGPTVFYLAAGAALLIGRQRGTFSRWRARARAFPPDGRCAVARRA
jgi:hypothetical protein